MSKGSLIRIGRFVSLGGWGEGKIKNVRGTMGQGKKGRGAPALSLFPSYHAHSLFLIFFTFSGIPRESLCGVRGGGGARGQKALFFFKDSWKNGTTRIDQHRKTRELNISVFTNQQVHHLRSLRSELEPTCNRS